MYSYLNLGKRRGTSKEKYKFALSSLAFKQPKGQITSSVLQKSHTRKGDHIQSHSLPKGTVSFGPLIKNPSRTAYADSTGNIYHCI